jgi:DNA-binding NarL/FixJ family response regulator
MIKVLLVDDVPEVRQMVKMRLALEPDIAVVGECDNGGTALDLIKDLKPDVVLMDIKMPQVDGISGLQSLQDEKLNVPVIILSIYDDVVTRSQAREAGAQAFVAKQDAEKELIEAIRSAVNPTPAKN